MTTGAINQAIQNRNQGGTQGGVIETLVEATRPAAPAGPAAPGSGKGKQDAKAKADTKPGDTVIFKQRTSGFFGTPLIAHLTQLKIDTVIIFGESTSGCVRASTVDGYSNGFHMVMAEECCFDRSEISHKVNLFDLHHKYADVMKAQEIVEILGARALQQAAE